MVLQCEKLKAVQVRLGIIFILKKASQVYTTMATTPYQSALKQAGDCKLQQEEISSIKMFIDASKKGEIVGKPLVFWGMPLTGKSVMAHRLTECVDNVRLLTSWPLRLRESSKEPNFILVTDDASCNDVMNLSKLYNVLVVCSTAPSYEAHQIHFQHRFNKKN
jgi:hypothetical protein